MLNAKENAETRTVTACAADNRAYGAVRPAWYCIRSHPKHEHIAAANLRQLPGVEVFNPRLRFVRHTRRGPVWTTESLFPNYLFARFVLQAMIEKVRYTPAVSSLVQFGQRPPAIPDDVIDELRRSLEESALQLFTDFPIEGQEVEISYGALQGANVVVRRVLPAKQRIEVLLNLMGRPVITELSLGCVLFEKRTPSEFVLGIAERRLPTALAGQRTPALQNLSVPSGAIACASSAP